MDQFVLPKIIKQKKEDKKMEIDNKERIIKKIKEEKELKVKHDQLFQINLSGLKKQIITQKK